MPAWIIKRLRDFDGAKVHEHVGTLITKHAAVGYTSMYSKAVTAWQEEIALLGQVRSQLAAANPAAQEWTYLIEFELKRRNKRADVILIADDVIFVIELKFGSIKFDAPDRWQAQNYALDLRDFHADSSNRPIVPVLVATQAAGKTLNLPAAPGKATVWNVQLTGSVALSDLIQEAFSRAHCSGAAGIDAAQWDQAAYRPTPTIIEAAERLYAEHKVPEISHRYATNLEATTDAILRAIEEARSKGRHLICLVTGVPGAGKTLTGLNAVHSSEVRKSIGKESAGIFLSGNGPLIRVIREALVRDRDDGRTKGEIRRNVDTFIHKIHAFLTAHTTEPPFEHVVVFDEAQRAWSREKVFKKRKIDKSEPTLLLEVMEQWTDWAVVVALVGGGQEIHDGEAGLEEWGRAILSRSKRWFVHASDEALAGRTSVAGHSVFSEARPDESTLTPDNK